jgi:hypothetical protein
LVDDVITLKIFAFDILSLFGNIAITTP